MIFRKIPKSVPLPTEYRANRSYGLTGVASAAFGYFIFVAIADFPKHRECQFVWAYWSLWSGYDLGTRPGSQRLCRCRCQCRCRCRCMAADVDVDVDVDANADRTRNPERIRSSSALILLFMVSFFLRGCFVVTIVIALS